jgi:pyruvate dehydrogenase E2 component (dihydrolipoamide acetyltransferase)
MKTFTLPDLGEGLQDAEIVSWHVSVGQRVVADQPLVAIETEKAVVEVPAPWSGTISKLHANVGDVVAISAPLVDFEIGGSSEDAGAVVGELPAAPERAPEAAIAQSTARTKGTSVKAAPAVRKLAGELDVNLEEIAGTGPGGAITRKDLETAAGVARTGVAGAWERLRGVRRVMARNMARAQSEVATTNVTDEANIARWADGEDITLRLVRAMVAACIAEPALNAWYDAEKEARLRHERIDLGLAMDTKDGLFVPVLRDAGNRQEADLRAGLEAMKRDVSARTVPPAELRGQTITLSNFGMIGGRHATLIVMPPQVAIVGAGRITQEPRVVDGEIRACRVLPVSLTFDHRAVTGAEATRFLMAVIQNLES